ncbi:hypothetical protein D3C81_1736170 [compost metagenome]
MLFGGFLEYLANGRAGVGIEQAVVDAVVEDLVNALTEATYGLKFSIGLQWA